MSAEQAEAVSESYRSWALNWAAGHSAVFLAWSLGVADDPAMCAAIATLPASAQQPNLVFASARFADPDLVSPHQVAAREDEYERFAASVWAHQGEVFNLAASRATQTNEAARQAAMLPALAEVAREAGRPLALIELGASAGLCLHHHAWRYEYRDRDGAVVAQLSGSDEPIGVLPVTVKGTGIALPGVMPAVGWRLGIDRNPMNPADPADADWLRVLIWPGQSDRLARLDLALANAVSDRVAVLPRDLTTAGVIGEVLALVPREYTPVLVHSMVLTYLDEDQRAALTAELAGVVAAGDAHWISCEGMAVLPEVMARLTPDEQGRLRRGAFVVAVDGVPRYQADGHAGWIADL